MPIHDWSRVDDGVSHDFHCGWIVAIRDALNEGLLPSDFYAMAERYDEGYIPDVLALQEAHGDDRRGDDGGFAGATAVAVAPPRVRTVSELARDAYLGKQKTLVVRRESEGDRVVALIEVVSAGNKGSGKALRQFVEKALGSMARGHHLLILDLHQPTARDPQGIHGAIWQEAGGDPYEAPADQPLTLAAYAAGIARTAYVEPVAVHDPMPDMPLFLAPRWYVNVPLEATYLAAWRGTPRRWRDVLDPPHAEA